MLLPLSRAFTCRFGAPVLDRVDPRIFTLTSYAYCMKCGFCQDSCCQYGADTEMPRVKALEAYQAELETYLGIPRERWFREDPEDFGVLPEAEYPGGEYTRTAVEDLPAGRSSHNEEACVFLDRVGRGCKIHAFALERGIVVHEIKPMICLLFPLSFEHGVLKPAYEFDIDDLVCQGPGPSLYQAAREDALYYFGPDMIAELDRMQVAHPPTTGLDRPGTIALPMQS